MNDKCKGMPLDVGAKVNFLVVKKPDPNGADTRNKNGRATDVKVLGNSE